MLSVSCRPSKIGRFEDVTITFTEEDACGVHFAQHDAIVVKAIIGNFNVSRILIDNGSSCDILYSDCLTKMGIDKSHLTLNSRPLYGVTGDIVIPERMIKLAVIVGEGTNTATIMANFLVIKGGDQYNAMLGRPTLRVLKAITFVYH